MSKAELLIKPDCRKVLLRNIEPDSFLPMPFSIGTGVFQQLSSNMMPHVIRVDGKGMQNQNLLRRCAALPVNLLVSPDTLMVEDHRSGDGTVYLCNEEPTFLKGILRYRAGGILPLSPAQAETALQMFIHSIVKPYQLI